MRFISVVCCGALVLGCGDDGGASTVAASSTGSSTSTEAVGSSGEMVTTDVAPTGTGETSMTSMATTMATTTMESTGSTTEGSSGEESGSSTTSEETTGGLPACDKVAPGPFVPTLFVSGFAGSEDLGFDGQGGLALKRGDELVVVRADKSETVVTTGLPGAYGTRYLADGRVLIALPQVGEVIAVTPVGVSADFVPGLKGPNGVFPDLDGAVWITEFGGSRLLRVAADLSETTIVGGAEAKSANGVVYDSLRGLVFYTNYQSGQVRRVKIDGEGAPGAPELVTAIAGASPDGLTLDACGHLYVVDQGNSALYRVLLDEVGAATGEAKELASFASNVANAQFGVGEGFDDHALYLAGNPGDVYVLAVGVPGAPTVTVQ